MLVKEIIDIFGIVLAAAAAITIFVITIRNSSVKQTITNLEKLAESQKKRLDEQQTLIEAAVKQHQQNQDEIAELRRTIREIKDIPLKKLAAEYTALGNTFKRVEKHMETTNLILNQLVNNTTTTSTTTTQSTTKNT